MEKVRYCKKCGCKLSEETKGKYCVNCKGKKRTTLKHVIEGAGLLASCVVAVFTIRGRK